MRVKINVVIIFYLYTKSGIILVFFKYIEYSSLNISVLHLKYFSRVYYFKVYFFKLGYFHTNLRVYVYQNIKLTTIAPRGRPHARPSSLMVNRQSYKAVRFCMGYVLFILFSFFLILFFFSSN